MTASPSRRRPADKDDAPTLRVLDGVVGIRLRRLHALFVAHWARWFRDQHAPVTPVQGGVLMLIEDNPGITQVALARLMRVEPPTLTQALNPLIGAGLVARSRAAHDRRAYELRLSEDGRAAAETVAAQVLCHEADLLAHLSREEQERLYELLEKAVASAERPMAEPGRKRA